MPVSDEDFYSPAVSIIFGDKKKAIDFNEHPFFKDDWVKADHIQSESVISSVTSVRQKCLNPSYRPKISASCSVFPVVAPVS